MFLARLPYILHANTPCSWPAFAQNGKGTITVRLAAGHRGGLWKASHVDFNALLDFKLHMKIIEEQVAEPILGGYTSSYHAFTLGIIHGGLIFHITGKVSRAALFTLHGFAPKKLCKSHRVRSTQRRPPMSSSKSALQYHSVWTFTSVTRPQLKRCELRLFYHSDCVRRQTGGVIHIYRIFASLRKHAVAHHIQAHEGYAVADRP